MSATWFEAEAVAILARPVAFQAKEQELTALFARLDVPESRALYERLRVPRPDDALAIAFNRLVADRRRRVLAFVGDTRRRRSIPGAMRFAC
ncbi:hypothetical protein BH11MYX2_BH11MYX2_03270 [soil metagenome]